MCITFKISLFGPGARAQLTQLAPEWHHPTPRVLTKAVDASARRFPLSQPCSSSPKVVLGCIKTVAELPAPLSPFYDHIDPLVNHRYVLHLGGAALRVIGLIYAVLKHSTNLFCPPPHIHTISKIRNSILCSTAPLPPLLATYLSPCLMVLLRSPIFDAAHNIRFFFFLRHFTFALHHT